MNLRKTPKFTLGVIAIVSIISAYLILQTSTVAAYNKKSKSKKAQKT